MITFAKAKNGDNICIKDEYPLHSNYNPQKEAERFVSTLDIDYEPVWIIITEPALSYTAAFLRQRFPNTKLCAIRFTESFSSYDNVWDKVFYFENNNLKDILFDFFGEEKAASLLFISWKPSENAFPDISISVWKNIKSYITLSRDVLGTRIYFNKRWNKNSLKFSIYINKAIDFTVNKINKPFVITASGPSLKKIIPYLKSNRNSYFLLALSSAVKPLFEHQIIPDAIISTDGGWYAQEHLKQLTFFKQVPLFLSSESYISNKMLYSNLIIPISYKDSIESLLLEKAGISALKAQRNGTVSGTAAELALQLTEKDIFFCGLDLSTNKGFQHTQPNELEIDKSIIDSKLHNLETRLSLSTFGNPALDIYRNWFSSRPASFSNRIKRIYFSDEPLIKLNNIIDIDEKTFEKLLAKESNGNYTNSISYKLQKLQSSEIRVANLFNYFNQLKNSFDDFYHSRKLIEQAPFELELWFKSLSLGDYLSAVQRHEKMSEIMNNKLKVSLEELEGILLRYDKK